MDFRALAPSHLLSHSRLVVLVLRNHYIGFVKRNAFSGVSFSFSRNHHINNRMGVVYAFSGVSKALLQEGRRNGRRKSMTRQDP